MKIRCFECGSRGEAVVKPDPAYPLMPDLHCAKCEAYYGSVGSNE